MYSTYNESTSAITERFIKTLKAKIYKKMTANDSNFMINAIILIIIILVKNLLILILILCLKKIETNPKAPNFKVNDRVWTSEYQNITDNWARKIFIIDSVLKTNPWTYKIKDLYGEK